MLIFRTIYLFKQEEEEIPIEGTVQGLVAQLCANIMRQNGLNVNEAIVSKLKSKSFEILLKKSPNAHKDYEDFDPQRELDKQVFIAKLTSRGSVQEQLKLAEFDEKVEFVNKDEYFQQDTGRGVLQLLLSLQRNTNNYDESIDASHSTKLLVPGPFTLLGEYKANDPFPRNFEHNPFGNLKPQYFKGLQEMQLEDELFQPKFLFNCEDESSSNKLDKTLICSTTKMQENFSGDEVAIFSSEYACTFTGMTRQLNSAESFAKCTNSNPKAFRLFPDKSKRNDTPNVITTVPKKIDIPLNAKEQKYQQDIPEERRVFSWSWESLGCFGLTCSKPFVSDTNVVLDLQAAYNQKYLRKFEAKIVTQQDFMRCLKALTVGIQSDIFHYDANYVFTMDENITVPDVLPQTIFNYITDFLECGTCYKRLQIMIKKQNYKLMFEGFMFKALCGAVDEYLMTVRQVVFAVDDLYLITFYQRIKFLMKQISNLCYTFAIHRNAEPNIKPPLGSQLICYLYREIMRLTENDYISLLIFILKRCCHVYFKYLQKWIYYGILDDPANELFICFVGNYHPQTKYFYDKAYILRRETVPGFFQSFDEQILQCGKYTMLLKACKPNHPLFDLEYPPITVCLSFDEMQKLENKCHQYMNSARKVCGEPVTIKQIYEDRLERKRNFFQKVKKRWRNNMDRWSEEQHILEMATAARKKQRFDELTLHLNDVRKQKAAEQRLNIEQELIYLHDAERMEEVKMICGNVNLRKRVEYYQDLNDSLKLDEKKEEAHKTKRQSISQNPKECQANAKGSTSSSQTPQTPLSGQSATATEFDSCLDEDNTSDYGDCLSNEFVEKFAESEKYLSNLYSATDKTLSNSLRKSLSASSLTEVYEQAVASDGFPKLKRSISDVINSNEMQEEWQQNQVPTLTEAQRNKLKVLTQEYGTTVQIKPKYSKSNPTSAQRNKLKNLSHQLSDILPQADSKTVKPNNHLTEAQKNKLKVLSHEYGNYIDVTRQRSAPVDINLNPVEKVELTDLQRNRERVMNTNVFKDSPKTDIPNPTRTKLYLDLNTEGSRNRQKVLESEWNIVTGLKPTISSTTFIVPTEAATPMSTTSDTPMTHSVELKLPKSSGEKEDALNGNMDLKIDIDLANESASKNSELLTAATIANETPEYALNTAGIASKHGFDFTNEVQTKHEKLKEISDVPIQNSHEENLEKDDTDCNLCDSSISCTCSSRFIHLRLNLSPPSKQQADGTTQQSVKEQRKKLQQNSMCAVTLTEFLQKSVIIPMSAHMELVNNEVMRMFLVDLHFLDHMRSLRNYYFLMDGEFGSIICDGIIGALENGTTPGNLINYQMLHSILDSALGSSLTGDKNAENLSFALTNVPEKFDLFQPGVLDVLSLSYTATWPLNLILTQETLEQYSNIFKYLIKVRRISWVLERAYQILKEQTKRHGRLLLESPQYRHVQLIRHKFYHFVHTLQNHITSTALQASWKKFKDDLLQAKTIEDLYRKHANYVKRVMFLCLLNKRSAEFYNTMETLFKISLRFYNNLKSREFKFRADKAHFTHSRYEKLSKDEMEFDKLIVYIIYLVKKIVRRGYQEEIGEFINLINFNKCYTE